MSCTGLKKCARLEIAMNRTERFYLIDQMLSERKVASRQELIDQLCISWATPKRDVAYLLLLRNRNTPISNIAAMVDR